jgi:hypothetical protein
MPKHYQVNEHSNEEAIEGYSIVDSVLTSNKRLSIAKKRKMKKNGLLLNGKKRNFDEYNFENEENHDVQVRRKCFETVLYDTMIHATIVVQIKDNKKNFQDEKYFMAYGTENEQQNYAEESMQPRANLRATEAQSTSGMIVIDS